MHNDREIPPEKWETSVIVYSSTYLTGVFIGFIGSLFALFFLMGFWGGIGRGSGGKIMLICFVFFGLATSAIVSIFKSGRRKKRPLALGLLTGMCLLALLVGVCTFNSGPYGGG